MDLISLSFLTLPPRAMSSAALDIFRHVTPLIDDFLTYSNATTTQNQLYGHLDLQHLSLLERWWASYYIWWGNETVATGIMSFVMHEAVYFGRAIPWMAVDAIPWFQQWKLQPVSLGPPRSRGFEIGHMQVSVLRADLQTKHVSPAQIAKCTRVVLLSHFFAEFPLIFAFHPICCYFGMMTYEVPFTPLWLMVPQIAAFFVFEDMWHYWAHRALHWGPLYKNIHKLHHEFSAPIGLASLSLCGRING